MKQPIIRLLIAFLLFSFALTVLSSCGKSDPSPEPGETTAAETDTSETSGDIATDPDTGEETETSDSGNAYYNCYVSLGDSIAYGATLNSPSGERFSRILKNTLGKTYSLIEYNYGVNGDKSSDLLALLKAGKAPQLKNADLVTISIGANNLLSLGAQLIDYLASGNSAAALALIQSETFSQQVAAAVKNLENDIPGIIAEIRKCAPDAEIVYLTIYNPYKGAKLPYTADGQSQVFDIGAYIGNFIAELNEKITTLAPLNGYTVADVAKAFDESDSRLVNVVLKSDGQLTGAYDPHPNTEGHRVIAETVFDVLSKKDLYQTQ